jgi:HPt (histidine-containing phosphotransfer) domain-containing protein
MQEAYENDEPDLDIAELIPQYFALCRRDLDKLRDAFLQRQFVQVRMLGHNLKGSGGAYGFPELSEIGAAIEAAGKAGDETAVRAGIDQFAGFLASHPPRV